jgi:aspartate carbamoyltransferase regulatory subunit
MVRYALFILAVLGSAATAIAAINPHHTVELKIHNVTVIEKNQFWPLEGKLEVTQCAVADCSDTPQN